MIAHAGHRSGLGMPESSRGAWTQIWKLESFDEEIRFVGLSRHSGRGGMSQRFKPGDKLTLKCGLWSFLGIRARRGDAAVFLRYTPLLSAIDADTAGSLVMKTFRKSALSASE